LTAANAAAVPVPPPQVVIQTGWQLQDSSKVAQAAAETSSTGYKPSGWYSATVPGTVLTTLVNNHVYPEPLYGENSRPETIPDSLSRTSWWYRTELEIPRAYKNHHVWLNFDGINYSADVWVNGKQVGNIRGAFIRGVFDITALVEPGKKAAIAVLITPQPHPGEPHEHTLRAGVGQNGGITAIDGPTFLSTLGWDWIPAMRDRDSGIWQKVFLSATGPVRVKDPLVTTDLPLPRTDSADIAIQTTLENISDQPRNGVLQGTIENIHFERPVELDPHSTKTISFDAKTTPALHMDHPRLWWPNGYGEPNLYQLRLSFNQGRDASDAQNVTFGIRKITYNVPGTDTLTISVNGVPVFIRGGDWGLDEAMKRIPRARLDTQIRLHKLANLNLIRNWVGQSTGEDFYDLCDRYGILVWDEFFQPNPADGPDPTDIPTYIANVRDKVLRFRNHASIALWCARNEGYPPPQIDAELRKVLGELEPTRRYQPSSTDGAGVRSHGPYYWRVPRAFYKITDDYFKTETGSVSVPTLESIQGMMPKKDWESINDDWAQHDFTKGNSHADRYPEQIATRYGKFRNLADFVRKSQLANYEAFRAMYEGRNAKMFNPTTAIITWMSDPAQPSFVWQIYHYDFEPMSSYFGVMHASEMVHAQFNEDSGQLQVINNLPTALENATIRAEVYDLNGARIHEQEIKVNAPPSAVANLGTIDFPANIAAVHFIRLELRDSAGTILSRNFYWHDMPQRPEDFNDLNKLPKVTLTAQATSKTDSGKRIVTVTLRNPAKDIALMAHVQLRRQKSGSRVLPAFYSDNYISLVGNETRTITVEADESQFNDEKALLVFDGWNVTVAPGRQGDVAIAPNLDAQPEHSPETGLPYQTEGLR
jgi:hypothetical protein